MDGIRNVKRLLFCFIAAWLAYWICLILYEKSINGSRNQQIALPGNRNKIACANTTLGKWACKYGIYYSNTNKNGEFEKAEESNGKNQTANEFSNPKTLLALLKNEHAPSELVRLVEIMMNRRGMPNYFMEKITPGQRKKYSDSNVVFMHHHKAGGTTTKFILERIQQELRIPSILIHIMNIQKQFAFYKANGTSERTIFNGGCAFGICDVLHGRPCSYMTVNRDPYDRVISSYFFCLETKDWLCGPVNVKNMSIVPWAIHQGSHFFRQLLLHEDTCKMGPNTSRYVRDYMERTRDTIPYNTTIREEDTCWLRQKAFLQETLTKDYRRAILNYCLDNLHKWFAVIGLLEEFDISLQLFEATFGLPFKKFFTGSRENVGIIRSTLHIEKNRKLRAELERSPEVKEALHEDLMIYEATKKIMKFQKEVFLKLENETPG